MQGIPMVASSPVRHESPLGINPIEVQSYQPPWKALTEFALHTDLDRLDPSAPPFQHLVSQVSGGSDHSPETVCESVLCYAETEFCFQLRHCFSLLTTNSRNVTCCVILSINTVLRT
jgi:hypothetical protein